MARNVLVVIDMQNDFTYGALRNEDAIAIIPDVVKKIKEFPGEVLFTRDTHQDDYMSTQEGRKLPVPHCIEGSQGWELVPEINALAKDLDSVIFDKPTFGSVDLQTAIVEMNEEETLDSIEFIGVCTDICVISNAMLVKAALPELTVRVDSSCCAGVSVESHNTALNAMKACQIEVY